MIDGLPFAVFQPFIDTATGRIAGVEALARLRDAEGQVLGRIELFPAVSENPTLTFDLRGDQQAEVWLRDNNGNEFQAAF